MMKNGQAAEAIKQMPLIQHPASEKSIVYIGDAYRTLRTLPEQSFQTAITSPPYWGLRDYEIDGQIGSEHYPCTLKTE